MHEKCLREQMRANTIRSLSFSLILCLVFFSALIASPRSKDRGEKGKEYICIPGRSGEDEVKSDFPSIYTCVCKLENDTNTVAQIVYFNQEI